MLSAPSLSRSRREKRGSPSLGDTRDFPSLSRPPARPPTTFSSSRPPPRRAFRLYARDRGVRSVVHPSTCPPYVTRIPHSRARLNYNTEIFITTRIVYFRRAAVGGPANHAERYRERERNWLRRRPEGSRTAVAPVGIWTQFEVASRMKNPRRSGTPVSRGRLHAGTVPRSVILDS